MRRNYDKGTEENEDEEDGARERRTVIEEEVGQI